MKPTRKALTPDDAATLLIGTPVTYWPLRREDGTLDGAPLRTRTRSDPWALGHAEIVVKVEGITGGVCITHLVPDPESAGEDPRIATLRLNLSALAASINEAHGTFDQVTSEIIKDLRGETREDLEQAVYVIAQLAELFLHNLGVMAQHSLDGDPMVLEGVQVMQRVHVLEARRCQRGRRRASARREITAFLACVAGLDEVQAEAAASMGGGDDSVRYHRERARAVYDAAALVHRLGSAPIERDDDGYPLILKGKGQ